MEPLGIEDIVRVVIGHLDVNAMHVCRGVNKVFKRMAEKEIARRYVPVHIVQWLDGRCGRRTPGDDVWDNTNQTDKAAIIRACNQIMDDFNRRNRSPTKIIK